MKQEDPNAESESLRLFKSLSQLCSVTSSENRVYAWLLNDHWLPIAERLKHDVSHKPNRPAGQRLESEFAGGTQLAVHWTGDPSSPRRLMMLAHCDTEGYILDGGADFGDKLRLNGWHPNPRRKPVNEFRRSTPVRVAIGRGAAPTIFDGVIDEVNRRVGPSGEILPDNADGAVCVSLSGLDQRTRKMILDAATNQERGTVTAVHAFDIKVINGVLQAPYIDNGAGVAICTAVLSDLIRRRSEVNASVLFTSGEEAGFAGLLQLIGNNHLPGRADPAASAGPADEIISVVVDCSDYTRSQRRGLDEWREMVRSHEPASGTKQLCSDAMAAVRLGDVRCDFNPAVTRFLYQSALQARVDAGRLQPLSQDGVKEQMGLMGMAGVFEGGMCEASICAHAVELAVKLGEKAGPPMPAGSVAIPLWNFRAIDPLSAQVGGDSATHQPERMRISALNSTFYILQVACELNMTYPYPGRGAGAIEFGFRVPKADEREEFLKRWVGYAKEYPMDITEANRRWVSEHGNSLASRICVTTA